MESGINCWSLERNDEEGEGIEVMEINIGNENLEEDILVTALTNLQVVPVAPESLDIPTGYRVLSTASPHEGNENLEEDNSYELLEVQSTESMEWNDEDTEEVMNTYEGNENLEEDNSYELLEVQSIVKPEASSCNTIRERLICNTPNNSFLRHHKTQLVFPSQTNDVEMEEYAQHPQQTIVEGSNECVCNLELDNIPVLALPQESNLGLPHSKSMLPTEESGIEVKTKQISVTNSVIISPSSLPYQSSQEMDAFLSRSVAESQHGGLFAITYKKGKCIYMYVIYGAMNTYTL